MFIVFFLLSGLLFLILIVGLLFPKFVIRWGDLNKRNRKRVLLYYGLGFLLSFILFSVTSPELTAAEKRQNEQERIAKEQKQKAEEKEKEEAEAKKKADEKAKKIAEAKKKADEKAKKIAEAKKKADEKEREELEAKKKAEEKAKEEAEVKNKAEEAAKVKAEMAKKSIGFDIEEFVSRYNKSLEKFDKQIEDDLGDEIPTIYANYKMLEDGKGFVINYHKGAVSPDETGNVIESMEIRGELNEVGDIRFMSYYLYQFDETDMSITLAALPNSLNNKLSFKKGYNAIADLITGEKSQYVSKNIKYTFVQDAEILNRVNIFNKDDKSVPIN